MSKVASVLEYKPDVLVKGQKTFADVNEDVCIHLEQFPTKRWWICFLVSVVAFLIGAVLTVRMFQQGLGVLGLNQPVVWGTFIVNFVFWIEIGHAGTLISALLFLFRQRWRTSINRAAESMTIFAVLTAAIYPVIHTGRPWYAIYWLLPYPNQRELWVNFRSPLLWDVFALGTYFVVSCLFWFLGLIPDLATVRDRARHPLRKFIYTILSLGWRGSQRSWSHYEIAYLILAALATPLVMSVQSIVSFDFAVSQLPGWHATIFPPYFVVGSIFSGFAMVITLLVMLREALGFQKYVTIDHLEKMGKIVLAASLMMIYMYFFELFMAWYSGNPLERYVFLNRALGPYAWGYWIMIGCNILIPQIFWWKKARRHVGVLLVVSLLVNVGMWFERYVLVVTSLHRDTLPANWGMYVPTFYDWGITLGGFGLFFTCFLLFVRLLPTMNIGEVKGVMKGAQLHS